MKKINDKMQGVLDFVENYVSDNGFPPSVREICAALGIKSTASCQYYLKKLEQRGDIKRGPENKKRSISISDHKKVDRFLSVPLIGTVTAGVPIFAYENLEGYYPLPTEFGNEDDDLFMLKVKGESMIDAGIYNGDKIIIQKTDHAENGDIVVAFFDDAATVKRFYKRKDKIVLHPENQTMTDIILDDVTILGRVKGLVRKF